MTFFISRTVSSLIRHYMVIKMSQASWNSQRIAPQSNNVNFTCHTMNISVISTVRDSSFSVFYYFVVDVSFLKFS